jgi:hypothetical protein
LVMVLDEVSCSPATLRIFLSSSSSLIRGDYITLPACSKIVDK